MALSIFGDVSRTAPDEIRVVVREPELTKYAIRAKTGGEFSTSVVAEISNANPARMRIIGGIPYADNTVIKLAKATGMPEANGMFEVRNVSGEYCDLYADRGADVTTILPFNTVRANVYTANSAICAQAFTGSGATYKYVLGKNLDLVKQADYFNPSDRANRVALRDRANYAVTGTLSLSVSELNFKARPYDNGLYHHTGGGSMADISPFEFVLYLKLSASITDGSYTLTFPAATGLSPLAFTIADKTTRCHSIAINQTGMKPGDESKIAYLWHRRPQGINYGQVDLVTDYSITDWHIINSSGTIVWSAGAAPQLRSNGTTTEVGTTIEEYSMDPDRYGIPIANVTLGNPTTIVTQVPHGRTTGNNVRFFGTQGVDNGGIPQLHTNATKMAVTVIDTVTFTVPLNTSSFGAHVANTGLVLPQVNLNLHGSYCHLLDFSAASLTAGVYYLYIPGFGVSDPINLVENAWGLVAKNCAAGLYHQASGLDCDGRYGYTRDAGTISGADGTTVYVTDAHDLMGEQSSGPITVPLTAPWIDPARTASVSIIGGTMDAGDWDLPSDQNGHYSGVAFKLGALALIPKAARYKGLGWPTMKEKLGDIYTRKIFSDVIETAIWDLDWARRMQAVWGTGGVPSARQFDINLSSGLFNKAPCPSYLSHYNWTVCLPNAEGTGCYASATALLAWHLYEMGHTDLGDVWKQSAIDAYNYCNTVGYTATNFTDSKARYLERPATLVSANPLTFSVFSPDLTPLTPPNTAGTWTRNGTTLTGSISSGGINVGTTLYIYFEGTGPADGYYTTVTGSGATWTITVPDSGPTSGTLHITPRWTASGFTGGYTALNGNTYTLRLSGNNIVVYDSTNTTAVDASAFGAYTADTGTFTPTTEGWNNIYSKWWSYYWRDEVANAAGVLYTLTGDTAYRTYYDTYAVSRWMSAPFCGYIYSLGVAPTGSKVTTLYTDVTTNADNAYNYQDGLTDRGFNYLAPADAQTEYGQHNLLPGIVAGNTLLAHKRAYDVRRGLGDTHAQAKVHASVKKYAKMLQDSFAFNLGANPVKMSMQIGCGVRSPRTCLHVDSPIMGVTRPKGNWIYYLCQRASSAANTSAFYWGGTAACRDALVSDDTTTIVPFRHTEPRLAKYYGNPRLVQHTEYDVAKTQGLLGMALYLDAWEGSAVQADGKTRIVARAA